MTRYGARTRPSTSVSAWLPSGIYPYPPANIQPLLWLDASDLTTITASSGAVSEWRDKSGNGFNVVQALAANQPKTGTRTQNSLNVIDFDGSDEMVSGFNVTQLSSSREFTALVVCKSDRTSATSEGFVAAFRSSGGDLLSGFNLSRRTTNLATEYGYGGNVFNAANFNGASFSNSSTSTLIFAVSVSAPSNSRFASLNGVTQTLTTFAGTMAASSFLGTSSGNHAFGVGARAGSNYFDGYLCEVVVYSSVLTGDQLAAMYTYFNTKWAVY